MLKKHKTGLILSSLLILLPMLVGILLWNRLPEAMPTHWGIDGTVDSTSGKAFAVFFIPVLMLGAQWLCLWITGKDPKNQGRNQKLQGLVLWIIPVVSLPIQGMMYAAALGTQLNANLLMPALFGLLFIFIGNYLPKTQQNYTMGIKIRWTLGNEENWNRTHRLAGLLWFLGGFALLFFAFLPQDLMLTLFFITLPAMTLIPIFYSYALYRKHRKEGIVYSTNPYGLSKRAGWISLILVAAVLLFTAAVTFTGNITLEYKEEAFTIHADFYTDLTVDYAAVEAMEYREGNVEGTRTSGFGSFRLLLGWFDSQEFGTHTRYTYYNPESCIILTVSGKTLVLSGETAADTQAMFDALSARIPQ